MNHIVDSRYVLDSDALRRACREQLAAEGAVVLPGFLTPAAVAAVQAEGEQGRDQAFYCRQHHNVYLTPPDKQFTMDHVRNRTVASSKGCIADDQIAAGSALRRLYDSGAFRDFLCAVLEEETLYAYADPLSSINLHYADAGQELGWHFDNSAFAITLLIQAPVAGGVFEYVSGARDSAAGDMGFSRVAATLGGDTTPRTLAMDPGALVLLRGRDALHRVTPVTGSRTRLLVVLAYNAEPGISLSESARLTFYGRLQ